MRARTGDIAARAETSERRERDRRESDELSLVTEGQDRLIASLSHELRNPLATALNAVEALESRGIACREIGVIRRQIHLVAKTLDDLLDVSRMPNTVLAEVGLLDLQNLVGSAIESVEDVLFDKDQVLDHVPCEAPLECQGDGHRLFQLVESLLIQASDVTPKGSVLRLVCAESDESLTLKIEDLGPAQEQRFDDSSPKESNAKRRAKSYSAKTEGDTPIRGGGLGIGLALVRAVAASHGGSVDARFRHRKSNADGVITGRRIYIKVKIPKVSPNKEGQMSAMARRSPDPLPEGLSVLLVEDEADNRELLSALLEAAGAKVSTAATGREAIRLAHTSPPKVAVIDIGLPEGVSGLDVARELRRQYTSSELRLIALTGYGQQKDREAIMQAGFDLHLVKPTPPKTLIRQIAAEAQKGQSETREARTKRKTWHRSKTSQPRDRRRPSTELTIV